MDERFRMIVEGPKQYEGVITQTLADIPGFITIPLIQGEQLEIDTSGKNELNKRWLFEREGMVSLVDRVAQNINRLNPSTIQGFASLYSACSKVLDNFLGNYNHTVDVETFVRDSLDIFQLTSDKFMELTKSPAFYSSGKNGKQTLLYRNPQDVALSPRDLRDIIGLYGLAEDEKKSAEQLAEAEGVSINTVLHAPHKLAVEVAFKHHSKPAAQLRGSF